MATKIKKTVPSVTKCELEDRIHKTFHFLDDLGHCPDADEWLHYHMTVAIKILFGESLKGTLIYLEETGEVKVLDKD